MPPKPVASGEGRRVPGNGHHSDYDEGQTVAWQIVAAESSVLWYFMLLSGTPRWGTVKGAGNARLGLFGYPPREENLGFIKDFAHVNESLEKQRVVGVVSSAGAAVLSSIIMRLPGSLGESACI
jgi:hypothetical protein